MLSKATTVYFPAHKALVHSNWDTNIAVTSPTQVVMSVLSPSLSSNNLTNESIPHLANLIKSARNLEKLELQ